jgi:hypothetical protein
MNSMAPPTIRARSTSRGKAALLWRPVNTPNTAEIPSVKRSRGHAKMRLKPVGTVAAVVAMV